MAEYPNPNNASLASSNCLIPVAVSTTGVGKKTAQQIVLDLKGKFTNIVVEEIATPVVETATGIKQLEEAREALLGLGYSAKEITKVWKELEAAAPQTTQEALSIAFKLLMK